MKVEQLIRLLDEKSIKIVATNDVMKHDWRDDLSVPLENYDAIIKQNSVYKFCKIRGERRKIPEIIVMRELSDEDEACNFFFLNRIFDYYIDKYVIPSRDYSIKHWEINTIIETMKKNNIPLHYLSYENNKKVNSIYYYMENNMWFHAFIGQTGEIIAKNPHGIREEEKDWFLSLCLNNIYPLYLLDNYEKELLEGNEISKPFSDIEKARFIGYNI
jgi:hypothetical protein